MKRKKKFAPKSSQSRLKYPLLEKRQKTSTVMERRVRRLLNEQTDKSHQEAWRTLASIDPKKRSEEWYFLSAVLRYRMQYLTDAEAYIDRAIELSGGKIQEYIQTKEAWTTGMQAEPIHFSNPPDDTPMSKGAMFCDCMEECCIEGCCECCTDCECCTEGCCEGCCDGCDCDCG